MNDHKDSAAAGERIQPTAFNPRVEQAPGRRFSFNPKTAGVVVLPAAVALGAWFLFSAQAVRIETEPADARVNLDGGLKLKLLGRYLALPGEYDLTLTAPGYGAVEEKINITDQPGRRHRYRLPRLPGRLRIETRPPAAAQIFINGESRGAAPALVTLPAGDYQVEVKAERYLPFNATVAVAGLDQEQSLVADLSAAWAPVSFTSDPPGAAVFNGDAALGETPLTAELAAGRHAVRMEASGYNPWRQEIDVVAGEPLTVPEARLGPADAVLSLASRPPGAGVTVNGDYQGSTPLTVALSPTRRNEVRLFKQGYRPVLKSFTAGAGERKQLNVDLQPELVAVAVAVRPAGAQLYVDGKLFGPAGGVVRLPAGKREIVIRLQGYQDYSTVLTLYAGVEESLNAVLKTPRQARRENLAPEITAPAGQSLKLFYPGAFTMGASRREPGRRANEIIRKVRLTRPFYLGVAEVTNQEYRLFDKGFSPGHVKGENLGGARQPVVNVSWAQAALYCNWLSGQTSLEPFYIDQGGAVTGFNGAADGYRLPTEAEWAWAARAGAGAKPLKFPWGEELPPAKKSGNFAGREAATLLGRIMDKYDDGFIVTAPVGSFAPNHRGLLDMGGNAAEWTNDFYDSVSGLGKEEQVDPMGPAGGELHVIRGSGWAHGAVTELRLSFRDYGEKARRDVGFRIARYAD